MSVGGLFTANLNADKIYNDLTYLADPILHKFWLTIQNQSLSTLYFEIVNTVSNWSLNTPANGQLGAVAAGVTSTLTVILTRANPAAEAIDTGSLTINAYSDAGYTTLVATAALAITSYIEDLENWTNVTITDFNDGTSQGWSGGAVTSEVSVEAGGYSYSSAGRPLSNPGNETLSRASTAIPNNTKVRVCLYLTLKVANSTGSSSVTGYLNLLRILIAATQVFSTPAATTVLSKFIATLSTTGYTSPWIKIVADISAYKNQSVTLNVLGNLTSSHNATTAYFIIDRVVIAGKD